MFPHVSERPCATRSIRTARRAIAALLGLALTAGTLVITSSPAGATSASTEAAVLVLINQERAAHHLKALRSSQRLRISAYRHNAVMAKHDMLSHQVPGEADLGTRVTRTTFPWDRLAENIGWNSDISLNGVLHLERVMYAEKGVEIGHKLNILDAAVNYVGVEIRVDYVHHKVWLTEDFGHYTG